MHAKTFLAIASAALIGNVAAEDAKVVTNNPKGVSYKATLPDKPFFSGAAIEGNVVGSISAAAPEDGTGVKFTVQFSNLPKSGGPFPYHLHVKKATGGNCNATLGHLDPYKRGDKPPCDADKPETCEVGDLSGKHGKITSDPFTVEYVDPYVSLDPASPAYFGTAAFVIHYANTTRLTCADWVETDGGHHSQQPDCSSASTGIKRPTSTGGVVSPTGGVVVPPTVPVTGGSAKMVAAPMLALAAMLL